MSLSRQINSETQNIFVLLNFVTNEKVTSSAYNTVYL